MPSSRTSSLNSSRKRLQQLQVQGFRQAADVVVRLDGVGLLGLRAGGFDHVRVDGALRQPFGVRQLGRLALEHLDEFAPDDLALLFRVGHAGQMLHEFARWHRRG